MQSHKHEQFMGRSPEMRDSPWLAAEDIDGLGDVQVVIDHVEKHHNVEFDQGRKKPVVYTVAFKGKRRQLVLNGTNRKTLTRMFGSDVKKWGGQSITLYVDPNVKLAGKTVPGIRIRGKQQ